MLRQSPRATAYGERRPTRSRALPRPLYILDDGKEFLRPTTLAGVRDFLKHIPKERRQRNTWQHVEAELEKAAVAGDTAQISISRCRWRLQLERIEYR